MSKKTMLLALLLLTMPFAFAGTAFAQTTLTVNDDAQGSGPPGATCNAPDHSTIQAAVDAALAGDTVLVCDGTYAENVSVNTANLTILGAQSGVDARTRPGTGESIVQSGGAASVPTFLVQANGGVIDGFTIQGANGSAGIVLPPGFSGYQILNNVIQNNSIGLYLNSAGATQTIVRQNFFKTNNLPGGSSGTAIYSDGGLSNALIDNNGLTGHNNAAVLLAGAQSNVTISSNQLETDASILLFNTRTASIIDNTITGTRGSGVVLGVYAGGNTDIAVTGNTITSPRGHGVAIGGGNTGITVSDNTITGVALAGYSGVRLQDPYGIGPSTDIQVISNTLLDNPFGVRISGVVNAPMNVNFNRIVGNTTAGLLNDSTLQVNAENNWWGCNAGPGNSGCDTVTGLADFDPWLVLDVSASPNPVLTGANSTITADLTGNSAGTDTSSTGTLPNGTPVAFSTDRDSVSPAGAATDGGKATTTFTAGATPGTANVSVTVDQQSTSAAVVVEEPPDTTAPETRIDSGPSGVVTSGSASFSFSSSEAGSFECSLDDAPFEVCSSPKEYASLSDGEHTFEVKAKDTAGNVDPTPASRSWTVDTTAPTVTTVSPADEATGVAASADVTATFSERMDGSTLNGSTFTLTKTGATTRVLADVSYDAATRKATLNPNSNLEPGATYTATVKGEPEGVRDSGGNDLAGDETWSFTIAPTLTSTPTTPTPTTPTPTTPTPTPPAPEVPGDDTASEPVPVQPARRIDTGGGGAAPPASAPGLQLLLVVTSGALAIALRQFVKLREPK